MKLSEAPIKGLFVIEPKVFEDPRGFFMESYREDLLAAAIGIPHLKFVQENLSHSKRSVLRGLHYQDPQGQAKLVRVVRGAVWDVAVDLRKDSPTYAEYFAAELSEDNKKALYIPAGFAHGFCVLSDMADFYYKCSSYYAPEHEKGLLWNSAELDIPWPVSNPILSQKDQELPTQLPLLAT